MQLTEYTSNRGTALKIDRENGVIRGVKILGLESKNGRTYTHEAIRQAAGLYEGAKVNVDHPVGDPRTPRGYRDRLGTTINIEARRDGLYGDFKYNAKHPVAEQLLYDAEHSPENVGFSHNVQAKTATKNGKQHVESITKVTSVDLVADPATTSGLFEGLENMDPNNPGGGDSVKAAFRAAVIEAFDDESLDNKATLARIKTILHAQEKLMGVATKDETKPEGEEEKKPDAPTEALLGELKSLREELDRVRTEKAAFELDKTIAAEIAEAKLPEFSVTEVFRASLKSAKDAAARKTLIEDRKAIAGTGNGRTTPKSKEQNSGGSTFTEAVEPKKFAAMLRG